MIYNDLRTHINYRMSLSKLAMHNELLQLLLVYETHYIAHYQSIKLKSL